MAEPQPGDTRDVPIIFEGEEVPDVRGEIQFLQNQYEPDGVWVLSIVHHHERDDRIKDAIIDKLIQEGRNIPDRSQIRHRNVGENNIEYYIYIGNGAGGAAGNGANGGAAGNGANGAGAAGGNGGNNNINNNENSNVNMNMGENNKRNRKQGGGKRRKTRKSKKHLRKRKTSRK
jgi:hypothetical protein